MAQGSIVPMLISCKAFFKVILLQSRFVNLLICNEMGKAILCQLGHYQLGGLCFDEHSYEVCQSTFIIISIIF